VGATAQCFLSTHRGFTKTTVIETLPCAPWPVSHSTAAQNVSFVYHNIYHTKNEVYPKDFFVALQWRCNRRHHRSLAAISSICTASDNLWPR
jgi:hypothetical protein